GRGQELRVAGHLDRPVVVRLLEHVGAKAAQRRPLLLVGAALREDLRLDLAPLDLDLRAAREAQGQHREQHQAPLLERARIAITANATSARNAAVARSSTTIGSFSGAAPG